LLIGSGREAAATGEADSEAAATGEATC
jgi:hypothetical protein